MREITKKIQGFLKSVVISILRFVKSVGIPFGAFFTIWLAAFLFSRLINLPKEPLTEAAVNLFIIGSAILAIPFAVVFPLVTTVSRWFSKSPFLIDGLSKRMTKATAYELRSAFTSAATTTMCLALTFAFILFETSRFPYVLVTATLLFVSMLFVTLSGIIDEREMASVLLQRFSENIEKSAEEKQSHLLTSRDFEKAFKIYDKTLPRTVYTASLGKRANQVELILCLGNRNDLSTLSKHILGIAQSLERDYLEGFDKEYLSLSNYLDAFVKSKEGVVDFVAKVPRREKLEKEAGAMMKEILVKTVPILIGILISVLVYLWLGLMPRLPSGT